MTGYLRTLFACVGMRCPKNAHQHLVDYLLLCHRNRLDDVPIMNGIWLGRCQVFSEYTRKNLKRLST